MKTIYRTDNEVLNELVNMNNDRVEGYQKASEDTHEPELKTIFDNMANESIRNSSALTRKIKQSGGDTAANSATLSGKVYRICRDVRAVFTGRGRRSILNSCKMEEDLAQAAYINAISSTELTTESRQLVRNQQAGMTISFNIIANYLNFNKIHLGNLFSN